MVNLTLMGSVGQGNGAKFREADHGCQYDGFNGSHQAVLLSSRQLFFRRIRSVPFVSTSGDNDELWKGTYGTELFDDISFHEVRSRYRPTMRVNPMCGQI